MQSTLQRNLQTRRRENRALINDEIESATTVVRIFLFVGSHGHNTLYGVDEGWNAKHLSPRERGKNCQRASPSNIEVVGKEHGKPYVRTRMYIYFDIRES